MWERYCRGVTAIVYMVDAADHEKLETAKTELLSLLEKPQLAGIPVSVWRGCREGEGWGCVLPVVCAMCKKKDSTLNEQLRVKGV